MAEARADAAAGNVDNECRTCSSRRPTGADVLLASGDRDAGPAGRRTDRILAELLVATSLASSPAVPPTVTVRRAVTGRPVLTVHGRADSSLAARWLARRFLCARVRGDGAERFLAPDARLDFNRRWWRTHLALHPLYAVPGTSYDSFRIAFVDRLAGGGPASYEVGYAMNGRPRRFTETLFVVERGDRLRIAGGRLGLIGP